MKLAIFVCVIIGAAAHQESVENNMNMLHARRLAGSSLRNEMGRDLCLPYALCLMGTMNIEVAGHREQFPTWAHGLFDAVLPLIKSVSTFKSYVKDQFTGLVDSAGKFFSDEDAKDGKTFRYLIAAHKVGEKIGSRAFCAKVFECPEDVTEDLKRTDEEAAKDVANAVDGAEPTKEGRILGLGCPPVGSKFCGAFWLACNFNGLVGGGIPGNACNFAALFCNAPTYICRTAPKETTKAETETAAAEKAAAEKVAAEKAAAEKAAAEKAAAEKAAAEKAAADLPK